MRAAAGSAARSQHPAGPAARLGPAPRPRRASGPARSGALTQSRRPVARIDLARGLTSLEGLHRRVALGGRSWIALVAFALIGIVTLQLGLLKLNSGIGRAIEHEGLLQRENAALSIANSELAASDHVTSAAARLGMQFAPGAMLRFLRARPGDVAALASVALTATGRSPDGSAQGEGPTSGASASTTAEQQASPSRSIAEAPGAQAPEGAEHAGSAPSGSAVGAGPGSAAPAGTPEAPAATPEGAPTPSEQAGAPQAAAGGESGGGGPSGPAGGGTRAGSSG